MKRIEVPKIDVTKYVGTKTKIEKAIVEFKQFGPVLKVESYPLDDLKDGKKLRASIMLGFMQDEDNGIYIGVDTKLDKFLTSKGVSVDMIPEEIVEGMPILELQDKDVMVQLNTKTGFLDLF